MPASMTAPREMHGLSTYLSVSPGTETDTFNLSGTDDEARAWIHPLTRRAAHMLWYRLTWILFPEKSPRVTGMAVTAPLRPLTQTTIAAFAEVSYRANQSKFSVTGWNGRPLWQFDLDDHSARELWAALDLALYPAGWGGTTLTFKPN